MLSHGLGFSLGFGMDLVENSHMPSVKILMEHIIIYHEQGLQKAG